MWRCLERETASCSRSGFESIGQRFRSFWRGVQLEQLKPPENCAIQAQCWRSPMTRRLYWSRSNGYWQQSRRNKQQVGKVAAASLRGNAFVINARRRGNLHEAPLLILLFGVHPSTAVGTDLLFAAS